MKYTEEDVATDLHALLKRKFRSTPTSISIKGKRKEKGDAAHKNDIRFPLLSWFRWMANAEHVYGPNWSRERTLIVARIF